MQNRRFINALTVTGWTKRIDVKEHEKGVFVSQCAKSFIFCTGTEKQQEEKHLLFVVEGLVCFEKKKIIGRYLMLIPFRV